MLCFISIIIHHLELGLTRHPGQLGLRFRQEKPEPPLSIGQVKFKIFFELCAPLLEFQNKLLLSVIIILLFMALPSPKGKRQGSEEAPGLIMEDLGSCGHAKFEKCQSFFAAKIDTDSNPCK